MPGRHPYRRGLTPSTSPSWSKARCVLGTPGKRCRPFSPSSGRCVDPRCGCRVTGSTPTKVPGQEALMGEVGAVFKRCGCRNPVNGKRLDRICPRLDERNHGTWYFACSAPNVFGRAERTRRGGYPSQAAAHRARDEWLAQTQEARTGRAWTVERWLRYWLSTRVSIRPTTRLSHAGYIEQFLIPHLGSIRLADLTARQL